MGWVPVMILWFESGNSWRILLKAGSNRFAGILLPGNAVREIGAAASVFRAVHVRPPRGEPDIYINKRSAAPKITLLTMKVTTVSPSTR